jgi:hypothetical protein
MGNKEKGGDQFQLQEREIPPNKCRLFFWVFCSMLRPYHNLRIIHALNLKVDAETPTEETCKRNEIKEYAKNVRNARYSYAQCHHLLSVSVIHAHQVIQCSGGFREEVVKLASNIVEVRKEVPGVGVW